MKLWMLAVFLAIMGLGTAPTNGLQSSDDNVCQLDDADNYMEAGDNAFEDNVVGATSAPDNQSMPLTLALLSRQMAAPERSTSFVLLGVADVTCVMTDGGNGVAYFARAEPRRGLVRERFEL